MNMVLAYSLVIQIMMNLENTLYHADFDEIFLSSGAYMGKGLTVSPRGNACFCAAALFQDVTVSPPLSASVADDRRQAQRGKTI